MSKKTEEIEQTQQQEAQEAVEQPSLAKELLNRGTLTITAPSRSEIVVQSKSLENTIPDGTTWQSSTITFDGKDKFMKTYIIIKE